MIGCNFSHGPEKGGELMAKTRLDLGQLFRFKTTTFGSHCSDERYVTNKTFVNVRPLSPVPKFPDTNKTQVAG